MLKSVFFITTLFLFLFLDNLFATNYNVSTTGNNGNAGTFGSPFATIGHAYSLTNPGDNVIVMPGTYIETDGGFVRFMFDRNGTASQPIVVRSYTKGGAVIDGQLSTTYLYDFDITGNYNVIDGFKLIRAYNFAILNYGNYNTIQHCEIDSNGTVAYDNGNGKRRNF